MGNGKREVMTRYSITHMRVVFLVWLVVGCGGCQRGGEASIVLDPSVADEKMSDLPADPFSYGDARAAYAQLREQTEASRARQWNGELEDFDEWLELQTSDLEKDLALLRLLRGGSSEVYAVANGRVALVYEHIATAMQAASSAAAEVDASSEWRDQQALIWDQAVRYWARCASGTSASGPHLDAWSLRCRKGRRSANTRVSEAPTPPPRQQK